MGVLVAAARPNPAPPSLRPLSWARPLSEREIPGWQMRVKTPGPAELPELEREKLVVAPASPLPGPADTQRTAPLPRPGLRVSEERAAAARDPPALGPPGRPAPTAALPAPPPLFPAAPGPLPCPQPAHLASPRRLGVCLRLRARPSGLTSPLPALLSPAHPFPLRLRAADPSGLRATSSRRASSSSLAQGLGPERREVPEPARVPQGFWKKPVLNPKAREE